MYSPRSRFLLFSDDICSGYFPECNSNNLIILISAKGNFIRIIKNDNVTTHLTRFTPSFARDHVKKLIEFRNNFVSPPFLCQMYHGST